jgi:putative transposase
MASKRQHRRNYNNPGHAHELTFSCYRGFRFLEADRTCQWLAESLETARSKWKFDLWAYVFMPEHVHLVIHTKEFNYSISGIRRAIKSPVAIKAIKYLKAEAPQWIPRISRQRGSRSERLFWQSGGGYDRNVIDPRTLMRMLDYIHLNPVRRGLTERAEGWKWSSAAWYTENAKSPIVPDPIPTSWLEGLESD